MTANLMFTEEELERTFRLSYFLFPDLNLALNLTIASCDVISRVRKVESRRLKSQKHYGEMIPSEALLQYAVFLASDGMEKEQENFGTILGSKYQITRDDFTVRYIKHLIWRASKQRSCYMAIALGCLLYRYNPMDIWHLSFGHFDSGNIRRVKAKVIRWLKERFEHTGIVVNSGRDIKFSAPGSQDVQLVQEALKMFTPWGHSHIQAPPDKTVLEVLFDDVSDVSDRLRIHAITDPDCAGIATLIREYNSFGTNIQFNDPDEMIEIPAFEGQPSDDPWKRLHPPSLTDTEKLLLRKAVEHSVRTRGVAYNIEELYEDLYSHFVVEKGTDDLELDRTESMYDFVCEIVSGTGSEYTKRYVDWCVSSIVSREPAINSYADHPSNMSADDRPVQSDCQLCGQPGYQTEEAVCQDDRDDGESFVELLGKVIAGTVAVEQLLEHKTYWRKVQEICSYFGKQMDEEDLRQQLHEKVLLNVHWFKYLSSDDQFFRWLFVAARGVCIDLGRRIEPVNTSDNPSSLSGDGERATRPVLWVPASIMDDFRFALREALRDMLEGLHCYRLRRGTRLTWIDVEPELPARNVYGVLYTRADYKAPSIFDFWSEYHRRNQIHPVNLWDRSSSVGVFNDASFCGYLGMMSMYVGSGSSGVPYLPSVCNDDLSAQTEQDRLTRSLSRLRLWVYCVSMEEASNLCSPIADRLEAWSPAPGDARSLFKGWSWPLPSANGTGVRRYYDLHRGREGSAYVRMRRRTIEGGIRETLMSNRQPDDWQGRRRSIMNLSITKHSDLYADDHIASVYECEHPEGSLSWTVESHKSTSTARSQWPLQAGELKYYVTAPPFSITELRSLRSYTVSNSYWRSDYFVPPSLWSATLTKVFREGAGIMKEWNEWRPANEAVLQAPSAQGRADYRCGTDNTTCSGKPESILHSVRYRLSDRSDQSDVMDFIKHGLEFNVQRRQNYTDETGCLVVHIDGKERLRFSHKERTCRPFRVSMDSMFIEVKGQDNYGYLLLAVFLVPDPGSLKKGDLCEGTITTEAGQVIGCIISPILSRSGNTVGNRVRITWNGPQDRAKSSEPEEDLQGAAGFCALYDLANGRAGDEQIV